MKTMRILLAPILTVAMALPAAAERLTLNEISDYFNSFETAVGAFTQINDDGSISTGDLYIKRPGRVRFEYDPPEQVLVVADGTHVGIVDGKSNTGPEAYPLRRTPLKIILAKHVDLTRERMVTGHVWSEETTIIEAQDPDNPEYGSIELVFTGSPVELRRWIINDGGGGRTTVVLEELETGVQLHSKDFEIPGLGPEEPKR